MKILIPGIRVSIPGSRDIKEKVIRVPNLAGSRRLVAFRFMFERGDTSCEENMRLFPRTRNKRQTPYMKSRRVSFLIYKYTALGFIVIFKLMRPCCQLKICFKSNLGHYNKE